MEKLIKGLFTGAVALGGLYALSVQGRTGHPGLESLKGWKYAHRGLHDDALPENSMAAFRAALEAGYGIELDIHLMKDGKLAVIHDTSLKRTAGADVKIGNKCLQLFSMKNIIHGIIVARPFQNSKYFLICRK